MPIKTKVAARIARRYLLARKSHSAVSIIAVVSVCGVALATMAMVCVLSVFNGFRSLVAQRDSMIIPDLIVTPAASPLINDADSLVAVISRVPGVKMASPVIEDNAVAYRSSMQLPVKILGVEADKYKYITGLNSMIKVKGRAGGDDPLSTLSDSGEQAFSSADTIVEAEGEFSEDALFADLSQAADLPDEQEEGTAILSIGAAYGLGLPRTLSGPALDEEGVVFFLPRRTATTLNKANPAASFVVDSLAIAAVVETEQNDFDAATVILDIDRARSLLEYDRQASSVYVMTDPSRPITASELAESLGSGWEVRDRLAQQSLHLRMISIEKWITYLLLSFILLIASFNVISTMSMLIIDKRRDIITLSRIGGSRGFISRIFSLESAYVCALGTVAGALIGVILCLLQQYFGFIKLGGDADMMLVEAYPVEVHPTDLLLVLVPGLLITFITSAIASRFAVRQLGLEQ